MTLADIISSDVFRGAGIGVTALGVLTSALLLQIKQRPTILKIEDEAAAALRESTNTELLRLAARLDQADHRLELAEKRHLQCEDEQELLRARLREQDAKIAGLERQLIQFQESNARIFATRSDLPADMQATLKAVK